MSRIDTRIARRTFLGAAATGGTLAGYSALHGMGLQPACLQPASGQRTEDAALKHLAFSVAEYRGRVAKVQQLMVKRGLEGLLLHNMASVCYVTGVESIAVHKYWLCL